MKFLVDSTRARRSFVNAWAGALLMMHYISSPREAIRQCFTIRLVHRWPWFGLEILTLSFSQNGALRSQLLSCLLRSYPLAFGYWVVEVVGFPRFHGHSPNRSM